MFFDCFSDILLSEEEDKCEEEEPHFNDLLEDK
jgi:hypothetical protein